MKTKHKVFFVAPCLSMGGIERAAVNAANGLSEHGVEVVFLSLFKKPHFFSLNQEITLIEPKNFNVKTLNFVKSVIWLRKEIRKSKPSRVLVFNKFYGALTAMALLGVKIPFYISERSSPFFVWKFPFNWINKLAYTLRPPEGVIAQTEIAATFQRKYYRKSKVVVIPNSVREVKLYPDITREKVILAVGRLNDHLKGFDLLLEAIALMRNQDWELHFAGGEENQGENLKNLAIRLGISNRVKFLGKVKDLDKCYAYAGLFAIPSRSEGFPNALAEAMAAGCCCVAFDFVAGPRELIQHGQNGMIVKNGDVNALAKVMDELIQDEPLRTRLGNNALLVRNSLSFSAINEKIKSFIING